MTAPTYPKRLIEVDLPIREISAHARREKSIRHGHISTLHIWWARRPLAACRAVLCASLWLDPADENCPQSFRDAAAKILAEFAEKVRTDKQVAELCASHWKRWKNLTATTFKANTPEAWRQMRGALLDFIADFANWFSSSVLDFVTTARAITTAAHSSLPLSLTTSPTVYDPFAGGGSFPLEALRVGADSTASDLNPVAVLLNRVLLEILPGSRDSLPDELRMWGSRIQEAATERLGQCYPTQSGETPIAYLWARTIQCEGPGCGHTIPLIRSTRLTGRNGPPTYVRITYPRDSKEPTFEVHSDAKRGQKAQGTVVRGAASCPICRFVTPMPHVRRQLAARHGGADDAVLMAVVVSTHNGRGFRAASERDLEGTRLAAETLAKWNAVPSRPDEPLPPIGTLGFRVQNYGMLTFGDLFTTRQTLALLTFCDEVQRAHAAGAPGDIVTLLALAVGRLQDLSSSLSRWSDTVVAANGGQNRLSMLWDFAEAAPVGDAGGSWIGQVEWIARVAEQVQKAALPRGTVRRACAQEQPLDDDSVAVFATDPPYYDAFAYADLSDLFLVWLKRALPDAVQQLGLDRFVDLAPKALEIVVNPDASLDGRGPKDHQWFETQMARAFTEGRRVTAPGGIGVVVFAHKKTESWEALLDSLIRSGWIVTASWPIDTERPTRQRAIASAALASSVHIVCRPRENVDGSVRIDDIGSWRSVLAELPERIREWMTRLAQEGVVGADAIFACLGPALEIFSRYSQVEKASGDVVTLKEYLEQVWAAVSKEALSRIFKDADAAGLEADGRLTAMWLWTLSTGTNGHRNDDEEESTDDGEQGEDEVDASRGKVINGFMLEFDSARKIAQGLGASIEQLKDVVEVRGDKAWLLAVSDRVRYLFSKDDKNPEKETVGKAKGRKRQLGLFAEMEVAEQQEFLGDAAALKLGETTLDRVHQAMILFGAGRSEALQRFVVEEGVGRDARFWKLADSLSKLYPASSSEKRWVDGVLARKKGLGF